MNAGFSNLTALKAQLLAPTLRARTDWDAQILALGLGVAAMVNGHCNRQFAREVGGFYTTSGGRMSVVLPRYPVETVTAIETRETAADDWVDELDALATTDTESGVVTFDAVLGAGGQIRITYTGGFFWETKEPTDAGYPTATPSGATLIPADVVAAWHLQVEALWRARDKVGNQIAKEPAEGATGLTSADLSPAVRQMLAAHVRYALT